VLDENNGFNYKNILINQTRDLYEQQIENDK